MYSLAQSLALVVLKEFLYIDFGLEVGYLIIFRLEAEEFNDLARRR